MSGKFHVRFRRRIRVVPGVTLNLSNHGVSTSVGVRGAHITAGRTGIRETVGLPGSGLYLTRFNRYARGVTPTGSTLPGFLVVILVVIAIAIALLSH